MQTTLQTIRQDEQGFTLVELAVVMIIIGILIGGILKGQELITNARVTSTISQMESFSAAYNDFFNQYNALPGDMNTAVARIGQCGALACVNGNGNGQVDNAPGGVIAAGNEAILFFQHLLGSGYITGLDGQNTITFGQGLPVADIGGGFGVGDNRFANAAGFTNANMRAGVWLTQLGVAGAAAAPGNGVFSTNQAVRVDTKLDDGVPNQGGLQTVGGVCVVAGPPATYNTADVATSCPLAYRL